MKRRWEETSAAAPSSERFLALSPPPTNFLSTTGIIPSVKVIFEGRSICHSVRLDRHASYESLAFTLRRLFVGADDLSNAGLDLSNAVPGHMVAYEDREDDLLLAGDLS
ncbi:Auxin-responsive protein IAA33 [Dendrobium catenatum]|uniref:Auxin-responsive protein IAA33 n=1 Tax=Dendrobium catenatum TaxID=906689 RepID=A0A2I0WT81_9ASPA|nr:Auxin-responsive protein IAA33 [Dendrobium catenatum]